MTKLRYLIAGLIACLIHGIALSYTPQKNTINVSTKEGAQSFQIQLMTMSAIKPEIEIENSITEKTVTATPPKEQKTAEVEQQKTQAPAPVRKPNTKAASLLPEKSTPSKQKKDHARSKTPTPIVEQKPLSKPEKSVSKAEEHVSVQPSKEEPETTQAEKRQHTPPAKVNAQDSKPMLVKKPRFNAKPTPVTYPRIARKKGLEGKVLIEVWLDEQGNQIKQLLLESSGHRVLDERALSTIKEWRFSNQLEQGQAIAHRVQIPINFQLQ
ncbi:energy transducer TonB [Vibrio diazotrophicus]|uniref:Energy transducer TonB n=1 Tax=Vibrio diazotrophicus TaxID=685 RepID=A0A2J8HUU1_VIBDI|nr:energy transducer TonB [Vibrio diazotrophicus]PNI02036.1 energy transducer TonB [Vibrio diazotrophicus]